MHENLTSAKSTKTNYPQFITTPLLLLFLLCSVQLFAQIPAGYYDAAAGKAGDQLKASLHDIIKGHVSYPYTSSSTDVWDILKEADKDPNNPSNVIGIYSGFSMDAAAEYASGSGWNREHVWAKSRGDFGTTQGAGTDAHHLRAADISTNSARNNRNFDYGETFYIDGSGNYSGPTESKTSSSTYVWEPRDEVKGDVARMIFYMATRYEGDAGEPDLELTETLLDNTDKSPIHARLSVLLEWHQLDPVSDAERTRNDVIYGFQNNRNPFIDHPEFVCLIYSCEGQPTNTAPSFTSNAITSTTEGFNYQYSISAFDGEGDILTITATTLPNWLTITDNGDATALLTGTASSAEVGVHQVVLVASDGSLSSQQSFSITVQATGGQSDQATDLFISEYIEGSSFNKGIELANYTGATIDLSSYSLFKQTNGAGAWSSELALNGTLANGEVYVIVHTSADVAMQAEADLVTGVAALTFNGNDPVALFKNGNLIDELGTFNNTADFGKDVTLVRKAAVTGPNATYTLQEWDSYSTDTFGNLGGHTIDLGSSADTQAPTAPTNVQATNISSSSFQINWDASTDNIAVSAYEVFIDGASAATVGGTSHTFTGLNAATTYQVYVVAQDAAGNTSSASSTLGVTTLSAADTEAPTAPTNLVSANVTANSFEISWDASTDNVGVLSYDVYVDDQLMANVTVTNYQLSGLEQNTAYGVVVTAKDASGNESLESEVLVVTTAIAADTEAPTPVQNITLLDLTSTSISIAWDASTDNVGVVAYDLFLNGSAAGTTDQLNKVFIGLTPETTYTIVVQAVDAAGNQSIASNIEATTLASQNMEPQIISQSFFETGWDDWLSGGSNAKYYSGSFAYEGNSAIQISDDRGEASSMSSIFLDVSGFNQVAFEFHFYSNRMDYGDQFSVDYFDGTDWRILATYTEGIDFTDRAFYVATIYLDRSFYNLAQNAQFRIQGLADNKRDQLYFDQITISGLSADSALRQTSEGVFTTIRKVGDEAVIKAEMSVYPNPISNGYVQLNKEYAEETEVSIKLFDARGNLVFQSLELVGEGVYRPQINVEGLRSGVYIIQLKDLLGNQELKKLVIK